jgi:hypothetical protein
VSEERDLSEPPQFLGHSPHGSFPINFNYISSYVSLSLGARLPEWSLELFNQ